MFSLAGVEDLLIFPAPNCSYTRHSYNRHLCWVPWNREIWIPPSLREQSDDKLSEHGGIPCLWFPAPKAALVMFFMHGNAEDLGMSFSFVRHVRDQFKVNVFAVEYPGYGLLADVKGCEESLNAVGLTAFRFLVDQIGVQYDSIILLGRSIGTGPACALASKYPVGGLILICAFLSIKLAIQHIAGKFVSSMFGDKFPNISAIQNVTSPTLFIHGENDDMIPVRHSLELFKRCRARKLLVTPPTMGHNSNLFGDAQYLAIPAINFFGLPGYCTTSPPRIPASYFVHPRRSDSVTSSSWGKVDNWSWFCGLLPLKTDDGGGFGPARSDIDPGDASSRQTNSAHPLRNGIRSVDAEVTLSELSTTLSEHSQT